MHMLQSQIKHSSLYLLEKNSLKTRCLQLTISNFRLKVKINLEIKPDSKSIIRLTNTSLENRLVFFTYIYIYCSVSILFIVHIFIIKLYSSIKRLHSCSSNSISLNTICKSFLKIQNILVSIGFLHSKK